MKTIESLKAVLIGGDFNLTDMVIKDKLPVIQMVAPSSIGRDMSIKNSTPTDTFKTLNYEFVGDTPLGTRIYEIVY
jgi:hypothetical protein